MKKIALVILFISLFLFPLFSQNTLIVYTKFPENLNFVDELDNELPKNNLWDENSGGYVLNYDDINKTYVESDKTASFKISTPEKLTKLILMNSAEKLSLINCLNSEKYCCERLTDKQKKGTEKLFAMAVMKKSGIQDVALEFDEKNLKDFSSADDICIRWKADTSIAAIRIIDLTDIEVIWETDNYENSQIKGSSFSDEIKSKFITDHNYQLNIEVQSSAEFTMNSKYSFDFSMKPLAFSSMDYYFPSVEAIDINWKTSEKIEKVLLRELYAENNLWESTDIQVENFDLAKIVTENNLELMSGSDYELVVLLNNPDLFQNEFSYPFSVLLDEEESAEMKLLLEGL